MLVSVRSFKLLHFLPPLLRSYLVVSGNELCLLYCSKTERTVFGLEVLGRIYGDLFL